MGTRISEPSSLLNLFSCQLQRTEWENTSRHKKYALTWRKMKILYIKNIWNILHMLYFLINYLFHIESFCFRDLRLIQLNFAFTWWQYTSKKIPIVIPSKLGYSSFFNKLSPLSFFSTKSSAFTFTLLATASLSIKATGKLLPRKAHTDGRLCNKES